MGGLQGESTLTNAEKVTEAKKLIGYLEDHFEEMQPGERQFVQQMAERLETWGDTMAIMNKQLFWLRDLYEKY